eukprot:2532431-Rhodomonas_salina.2
MLCSKPPQPHFEHPDTPHEGGRGLTRRLKGGLTPLMVQGCGLCSDISWFTRTRWRGGGRLVATPYRAWQRLCDVRPGRKRRPESRERIMKGWSHAPKCCRKQLKSNAGVHVVLRRSFLAVDVRVSNLYISVPVEHHLQ